MQIIASSRNGSLLNTDRLQPVPNRRGEENQLTFNFTISRDGNDLLTKDEVAKILRVTNRTIANYRLRGLLPYIKINEHYYLYPKAGIETLLGRSFTKEEFAYAFPRAA